LSSLDRQTQQSRHCSHERHRRSTEKQAGQTSGSEEENPARAPARARGGADRRKGPEPPMVVSKQSQQSRQAKHLPHQIGFSRQSRQIVSSSTKLVIAA